MLPIEKMDHQRNCCLRQYTEASHSVLRIFYLRFLIVTVYTFGLIGSIAVTLDKARILGLLIGILATGSMLLFDYKLQQRQTLFTFVAAKLERSLNSLCQKGYCELCEKENFCGVYNLYLKRFLKLEKKFKKRLEEITLEEVLKTKIIFPYFFKSRGIVYIGVMSFLLIYTGYYLISGGLLFP
jgi:hypothetical protein